MPLLSVDVLLSWHWHLTGDNVLDGLIRELEILLDRNSVLDLGEDQRTSEDKRGSKKSPL
jgi:hypothetical protein